MDGRVVDRHHQIHSGNQRRQPVDVAPGIQPRIGDARGGNLRGDVAILQADQRHVRAVQRPRQPVERDGAQMPDGGVLAAPGNADQPAPFSMAIPAPSPQLRHPVGIGLQEGG
jgi:hypothetical protein